MSQSDYDVVFVGAGFGSICTLHRLRKLGLRCHILEMAPRSGGVWYWNCYPGARVDSDAPLYQMFDQDIWQGFDFRDRYPDMMELRRYFDHIDSQIDFSRDTEYNVEVSGARWDEEKGWWVVECADGREITGKWFIPAIGLSAKAYIPKYKGLDSFKGEIHHSAEWPQGGIETKGKRIAVIGTGASGVQIIQETGPDAAHLTVYQRTPNLCLPMQQKPLAAEANAQQKKDGSFDRDFAMTLTSFAGFHFDFLKRDALDDTPEQRKELYEGLIKDGGFRLWLASYQDQYKSEEANREVYYFWRDMVRKRIDDPKKQEILAPTEPPHPWGTKRPSLEQKYYEIYNMPHVDLLDISADPVDEITRTGIRLKSGDEREFDVIALATGFDAISGGLASMNIRNAKGETIKDHWSNGLKTSRGVALHGFPNMFFLYGPQAPTAFSNGPSTIQVQATWVDKAFKEFLKKDVKRIEPTKESEEEWTEECHKEWYGTLFPQAKSWYQGSNIPGKRVEPLNYIGGMPAYIKALDKTLEGDWDKWTVSAAA